jgi:hypothetical protein
MQNKKLSIRKIVSYLNNDESEGGGFWLPNIQRPFVWSEDQIGRLFDSIMRQYPISTLLAWKTKEAVKNRKFIDVYSDDLKLSKYYVGESTKSKLLVLDGQQRLQSLYIGLKGSYCGRELYFDVLSGEAVAPEDIRFKFEFKKKAEASWPWIRFRDIILATNKLEYEIADELEKKSPMPLAEAERKRLQKNVALARQEFVNAETITYQELDGVDNPDAYKLDDVVEIFIRANSGGTKLGKSDLLFSLLSSSWEEADGAMEVLLEEVNDGGFSFDRDFVLKSCLSALGKGARYEVEKFRDGKTKEEIISKWDALSDSIKDVKDFVVSKTYIRSDKALPSYQALIPLVFLRYRFPEKFKVANALSEYLLRSLISGVFSGSPDNLIDKITRSIEGKGEFVLPEVYEIIRNDGRSLEVTAETIFNQTYGSRSIHLFFNLWYREFNYTPALDANGPQVDHIFPQSLLKTIKELNPETGKRNLLKYRAESRDRIANCMLLTAEENGPKGKLDRPPTEWFGEHRFPDRAAQERYFELHLIPNDPSLWEIENYEKFLSAREKLIEDRFAFMLRSGA